MWTRAPLEQQSQRPSTASMDISNMDVHGLVIYLEGKVLKPAVHPKHFFQSADMFQPYEHKRQL